MSEQQQVDSNEPTHPEVPERKVIAAMKEYGGGFVKALADAYIVADKSNRAIIRTAFQTYWSFYSGMAFTDRHRKESEGKDEESE